MFTYSEIRDTIFSHDICPFFGTTSWIWGQFRGGVNREHISAASLSEDDVDMKGAENLVKDATGDAATPSGDEKSPGKDDSRDSS